LNGILRRRGTRVKFDEAANVSGRFDLVDRRESFEGTKNNWKSEFSMVKMADACNFKSEDEAKMNAYWQGVSGYIDEGARLIVPILYGVFLVYVFKARV